MADAARLLADATAAFVDRAPIDWPALLSSVRASPDRRLFENLHVLAAVRDASSSLEARPARPSASFAAWIIVGVAAVQTIGCLTIAALALSSGESLANRSPQMLLAMAFAAASVPLAAATSRDPRSLFLLAFFGTAAAVFARSVTTGLPSAWSTPVDRTLAGIWIEAFMPACLWQFASDFPRVQRFTSFDRIARRAAAAMWIAGLLIFVTNAAFPNATGTGAMGYLLRNHSSRVFWRLFSIALVPAFVVIVVRAHRAGALERSRVGRFVLAIAGGTAPFVLLGAVRTLVPPVDAWFAASDAAASVWTYRAIVGALTATPILTTAAVLTDRPFVFQRDPRRTWRWSWRRTKHDDDAFARALDRIAQSRGTRERVDTLARELRTALGVEAVRILLPQANGLLADWLNDAVALRSDGALAALVHAATAPIDLAPGSALLELLPPRDRDWVAAQRVRLAVPMRRPDGGLGGVVAVGPKRADLPFDHGDRSFILAIIAAAAAACDQKDGSLRRYSRRSSTAMLDDDVAFECRDCGLVAASRDLPCECGTLAGLAALPARVAGKFLVERRLGSGGMGVVYLARDVMLDRRVALKTFPRLRPDAVRWLRDEARAMAALRHETLAAVHGLETWRGTPVLVLEYFPEGTLAHRLARGPLSSADTLALGLRLARALTYMHGAGVLHRDLKPSNIAIAPDGERLLDFGLAMPMNSRDRDGICDRRFNQPHDRLAGTPAYLAPEVLAGAAPSPAVDLWALAVVIVEAISGGNPFASPAAHRACHGESIVETFDSRTLDRLSCLRAVIERALAFSPARRFRTATEFHAALERVATAQRMRSGPA